jgi:hypothetical protein
MEDIPGELAACTRTQHLRPWRANWGPTRPEARCMDMVDMVQYVPVSYRGRSAAVPKPATTICASLGSNCLPTPLHSPAGHADVFRCRLHVCWRTWHQPACSGDQSLCLWCRLHACRFNVLHCIVLYIAAMYAYFVF